MKFFGKMLKKRNLVLSFIVVAIAVLLIPLEILGWFALDDKFDIDDFNLAIRDADSGGNLTIDGGSGLVSFNSILPGDYHYLTLNIENTSSEETTYSLYLNDLEITFPTCDPHFKYGESNYLSPDYYHDNVLYDVEDLMSEAVFRKFVTPVSDALEWAVYYTGGTGFDEEYLPHYVTSFGVANKAMLSSSSPQSVTGKSIFLEISNGRSVEDQIEDENGITVCDGAKWNNDGTITLRAGQKINLYLVVYFNPAKYVTANVSDTDDPLYLELRNSNPYAEQKLRFTVSID